MLEFEIQMVTRDTPLTNNFSDGQRDLAMNSNNVDRLFRLMNEWDGIETTPAGQELLSMIHPEYKLYDNGTLAASGRAAFSERIRALHLADSSLRQEMADQVLQDDTVVLRWTAESEHGPFAGVTWATMRDNQLFEVHQFWAQPHFQHVLGAAS